MTTGAYALGRLFNLAMAVPLQLFTGSGITGNRLHLKDYEGVSFVVMKETDAGTTDDLAVDLNEHSAASGGTSQDLDIITEFFVQEETTLDGDETWTAVSQTAASEIAARAGTAEKDCLWVIEVRADQLSDGFEWISLNVPDLGNTDTAWGGVLAILWGLRHQRAPENLPQPNA